MFHSISLKSNVMLYEIGMLLSMLLKSKCENVVSGMFGSTWKVLDPPKDEILANTIAMQKREGEVGYSTNGYAVIAYLVNNSIKMDKVMMFTDLQMWNDAYHRYSIEQSWKKYREMYPEAKLYLFDLNGYGQSPIRLEKNNVSLIAGWNERVFDVLSAFDTGEDAVAAIKQIEI